MYWFYRRILMLDFAPYRSQITAIDLAHTTMIVVVIIIQLSLTVISDLTGNRLPQLWVPAFSIVMLGLVCRLDTMVQRLGGFLAAAGDPWEIAKATHVPTTYLMPMADVLCMSASIGLLVYAEYRAWQFFSNKRKAQVSYLGGTLLFVAIGIVGWILAATKAKTGF
jgi:hypothetical protein